MISLYFAHKQGTHQVLLAHASKQSILSHPFLTLNFLSFLGYHFKHSCHPRKQLIFRDILPRWSLSTELLRAVPACRTAHAEHRGQQCQRCRTHREPRRVPQLNHLVLSLSGAVHQHQCEEEPCFQHAEPGAPAEGILYDLLKQGSSSCAGLTRDGPVSQGHRGSAADRPSPFTCRTDCISSRGEPCCCVFDPKGMCFNRTVAEKR